MKNLIMVFVLVICVGCLSQKVLFEGTTEEGIDYKIDESTVKLDWGEKPTTGYLIEIGEISLENETLIIYYFAQEPAEDQFVGPALTYPSDEKEFDFKGFSKIELRKTE